MSSAGAYVARRGLLLLADISGYTEFFQAVAGAHGEEMATAAELPAAYPLMTSLLDGIVERVVPPFELAKLEGDAVFAYCAEDSLGLRGAAVLACVDECYQGFRARRDEAVALLTCRCNACARLPNLELKFVLHGGDYAIQSIAGRRELLGPDVTFAHLLLKNTVKAQLGWAAYALLTERSVAALGVPVDGATRHTERYDHYEPAQTYVWPLPRVTRR